MWISDNIIGKKKCTEIKTDFEAWVDFFETNKTYKEEKDQIDQSVLRTNNKAAKMKYLHCV